MSPIIAKSPGANLRGENPMRYDCNVQGCFNKYMRPKLEQFAKCFPRRINFGDVDGLVEINSKALLLEWKAPGAKLQTAQEIMLRRLSATGIISGLCVWGNAFTMDTTGMMTFNRGNQGQFTPATLDEVKNYIRRWAECADAIRGQR